jgi:hypothetical protein
MHLEFNETLYFEYTGNDHISCLKSGTMYKYLANTRPLYKQDSRKYMVMFTFDNTSIDLDNS